MELLTGQGQTQKMYNLVTEYDPASATRTGATRIAMKFRTRKTVQQVGHSQQLEQLKQVTRLKTMGHCIPSLPRNASIARVTGALQIEQLTLASITS